MQCSYFFLTWKLLVSIYALALIPYGIWVFGTTLPSMLTFWGWCILTVYFVTCVLSCFWNSSRLPLVFLQELSFSLANVITAVIGYMWIFNVFPTYLLAYNTSYHVMNAVLMYLDLILFPMRFKLWHIIPVLSVGLLYATFSGIYYAVTGIYEYPFIDWQSITTLWWLLAAGAGIAVAFLVGFLLSRIGLALRGRLSSSAVTANCGRSGMKR